jgi:mannose-6-phosphate isomerase-like protein (cupin superfamily)
MFLGVRIKILLSSADTGGRFSLIEGVMSPGGDGGLHIHLHEDETMHLLEGQLEVTIGERIFMLSPGESYFAPRGIPQRLRNLGSVPARSLMIMSPSTFDEFIACAGVPILDDGAPNPTQAPTPEQFENLIALADKFGIIILEQPEPFVFSASNAVARVECSWWRIVMLKGRVVIVHNLLVTSLLLPSK